MSERRFIVATRFANRDRDEFMTFKGNIKSLLQLHPKKLHTVLFDNTIHASVLRAFAKELVDEGVTTEAAIEARKLEFAKECNEEAFAILDLNIADDTLQKQIRRDHEDDGHAAWQHIASLHTIADNDTRIDRAAEQRKDLISDGLTGGALEVVKVFCNKLEAFNVELHGTPHHFADSLMTQTVLDALYVHHPNIVSTYKARKAGTAGWKDKYKEVRNQLMELVEEEDRVQAKVAVHQERQALHTRVVTSEVEALRNEIAELRSCLAVGDIAKRTALRTSTRPACNSCGKPHGMQHGCIGERVVSGELTLDQAAALFTWESDKGARVRRVEAAVQSYKAHQASKPAAQAGGKPAVIVPTKKLAMTTKVVRCQQSATAPRVQSGGPYFRLGMDSKAEQHIFGDERFFPYGHSPPDCPTYLETIEGTGPKAVGVGTAVTVTEEGILIEYTNSLFVPGITAMVASVAQAMRQNSAEVRFGDHCDIVFHQAGGLALPLTPEYDLLVRPPTADDLSVTGPAVFPTEALPQVVSLIAPELPSDVARAVQDKVPNVITRGKSAGGPAARLNISDTTRLWSARLPGVSADRLRKLAGAAGVPESLVKARPEDVTDAATLSANAPKLHAPAVARRYTERRGECTVTDLIGPMQPAKFTNDRYAAPHVDMRQGTVAPFFMPSKDRYPEALRSYLLRNQGKHGCDFSGGVLYRDNEPVLNSAKVAQVLEQFGMHGENSCAYEPHQNPAERVMRLMQEPMRIMHERGGAGDEYWRFSMEQACLISDRTHHSWGAEDDGKTPLERKLGGPQPSLASFRPMFCLAFVRRPPALRASKLDTRADACIHLGNNTAGPGYRFEVLSGPRKGKLITSSQAVFRENRFPLKEQSTAEVADMDPVPAELDVLYPEDEEGDAAPSAPTRAGGGDVQGGSDDIVRDTTSPVDEGAEADMDAAGASDPAAASSAGDGGADQEGTTAPRRSTRLAGVELPQSVCQYRSFRGVLATRVVCADTEIDVASPGPGDDQREQSVRTFTTGVDMTDELTPRPLSIDPDAVPQAAQKTAAANNPARIRSFSDIMAIKDVGERERRLKAYYKEWDGLFSAPSGVRAVPEPEGYYPTVRLKEIHSDKKDGRAKMRAVVRGDLMREGVDYGRTFSPTVKLSSLRFAMSLGAQRGMHASGGDITQAYVNAQWPSRRPIYASQFPEGYSDLGPDGQKLAAEIGNLYGGPDSGRNWYIEASNTLQSEQKMCGMAFQRSAYDHSFFFRWESDKLMIVLLYVDDLLILVDKGTDMRERFATAFGERFPFEDFGENIGSLNEFLSIRVTQSPHRFEIDSERYITELAQEMFPGGVHAEYSVPAASELPKLVEEATRLKDEPSQLDKESVMRYRRLVGALLYVSTATRPEITYAVGMLTRCLAYPTTKLLKEAERVLIYLYGTRDLRLTYSGSPAGGLTDLRAHWAPTIGDTIEGKSDANWEVERSTSGYVFAAGKNNGAISWGMKKQRSITLSTAEAEISAGSLACCEAVWLRNLAEETGFPPAGPTVLHLDNSAAIDLSYDPVRHASSKHIRRRELFIRDLVSDKVIVPVYIKTEENTADIFTKPLARKAFQKHRAVLLGIAE